jgi:nucleotide-binding universal stress UspA family protein
MIGVTMKRTRQSARMFTAILCPVDFSAPARQALRHAVAISRLTGGRVTALYVNDPLLTAAATRAFDGQAFAEAGAAELKSFIKQAVGASDAARVTAHVLIGEPARVIGRAARRFGANLIVVGTRGLSGVGKAFFGSTTERLLRQTGVPVLAIPPAARGKIGKRWPGRRVLAGIDLDANSSSDVRAFSAIARAFGRPLTLVHVVEPSQLPPWLSGFAGRDSESRAAAARTALDRLASGLDDVEMDTRVMVGDPSRHIPKLATQAGADLIVLALRRGDGVFGAARGTITYRLLSSGSTIPVLAIPARARTARRAGAGARSDAISLDPSAFT